MAKIISITNQKGGVGKTTTAINLGAALACADMRVLIVDTDAQANCTSGLGFAKGGGARASTTRSSGRNRSSACSSTPNWTA